jgi:hypothetical protein
MKKTSITLFISCFICITAVCQNTQRISGKASATENFSTFQSRFFSESNFQLDRISFPLDFLKPGSQVLKINKADWTFNTHLHWSKTNPLDVHFKLIEVVDVDQNRVVHGKLDNGAYENYTFSLVNGNWKLIELEIPDL